MTGEERQKVIERGREASQILNSAVLEEAFEEVKREFHKEWLATTDERQQFAAWAKTHAVPAVQRALRRFIDRGEYEAEVLRRAQ